MIYFNMNILPKIRHFHHFTSLSSHQQRHKLFLAYLPISILIHLIENPLYLIISLIRSIQKSFHLLDCYKPRMVIIQIVESILQSLLLQHFLLVTSSHQKLSKIDSSRTIGVD